ncbi:MAG: tyrosine-type recombinase/integrase [Alphaproteobacteria bacterium]|nr:tyrosine-type recombinase/integrase [Alphaproteobacteria bacterium]
MPNLTKRFIESITPDPHKLSQYWDTSLKGFGVIVLPSGRCTYCIQYRNQNRVVKRLKIGVHGQVTTEEARALARKHLASVAHGEDPAQSKQQNQNLFSMQDLARDYIERHGQKKRKTSLKEDSRFLKNIILPSLGSLKVAHVSRRDIENLHLHLKDTPYQANRVMALLSKMFSLAVSWGWRADNPAQGIEKYQEEKRDRWLNDEELQRLWRVLDKHSENLTAYVFKFLLLTGARRGEALQATWEQFDLKKGLWVKPAHLTKQKKKEHLPLSDKALLLLETLKKRNTEGSPYLFPGKKAGEPLKEVKKFWRTVLKQANLENVRIHDLRHTHASHLVSSGLSLSIVGKLLGHTQASTTQRYAHLADEPLRKATEVFGNKVDQLMSEGV